MTAAGFIIMLLSVSAVTVFFGWTLYKVFIHREDARKLHSTLDETPDAEGDN